MEMRPPACTPCGREEVGEKKRGKGRGKRRRGRGGRGHDSMAFLEGGVSGRLHTEGPEVVTERGMSALVRVIPVVQKIIS